METVAYSTVLRETCEVLGLEVAALTVEQFRILRGAHARLLEEGWEAAYWADLSRVELRQFRDPFDPAAASYSAGTELYDLAEGVYVTALRTITDPSAAGQQPTDANGDVQTAYWLELVEEYDASEYDAADSYVAGDVVTYRGRIYGCHTASIGNLPTDTTYFGEVQEFDRYVGWTQTVETEIGSVAGVWDANPRRGRATELTWGRSENGVQVQDEVSECWVHYRLRCPELKGDDFDAAETYAVGEQVYWTDGEFYDCVVATSAGEDPTDTPASWSGVEIPRMFKRYLVYGAAGEWQRGQEKDPINGDRNFRRAQEALERELMRENGGGAEIKVACRM